jgi:hypothetical protein
LRPILTAAAPACARELRPPRAAAIFADAALRKVLEVADRRRPVAQLRPILVSQLYDAVTTQTRASTPEGAAVLRRG